MSTDWRILARAPAHQGFFRLDRLTLQHRRFDGDWTPPLEREVFERGDGVAVLPYDPIRDRVILIEQFRVGALKDPSGPWLIEIVAGIRDPGESPRAVAHRELHEEIGASGEPIEAIASFYVSPGGTSESISLFWARVDADRIHGVHGLADEHEDIRVLNWPWAKAWAEMGQGRIRTAPAVIALQWLERERDRLRTRWASSRPAEPGSDLGL
jgi:ADP-ribose pyrophosphatase